MRLFVAINFNNDTHMRLLALRDELRSRSIRGNFSLTENLHLTLAFLGEINPKRIERIETILNTVTFLPFEVTIERLGSFARGTLWWAGLRQDKPLMNLQHEIEHKLAHCGFKMDSRDYHPHITLGREIVTNYKPRQIESFGETISRFDLMKSERISGKLTYTTIYTKEADINAV